MRRAAAAACIALGLLIGSMAPAWCADSDPRESRLDVPLKLLLRAQKDQAEAAARLGGQERIRPAVDRLSGQRVSTSESAPLSLLVRHIGPRETLEHAGFRVQSRLGSIYAGTLAPDRLGELAELPGVRFVQASQRMYAAWGPSPTAARAAARWWTPPARAPTPSAASGAGAVVALIDTGVDIRHQDFRKLDGSTRIKYLLDFSDPGDTDGDGLLDGNGPYGGTLYTEADINAALQGLTTWRSKDTTGHGTHGLSIAAGDDPALPGLAPAADLVVVKATREDGTLSFTSTDIVNAVAFVDQKASELGLPCVANLSLGTIAASHDGRSLEEQAIDEVFRSGAAGRAVVVAAGNSSTNRVPTGDPPRYHHFRGTAYVGTNRTHTLTIPAYTPRSEPGDDKAALVLWYKGRDRLTLAVTAPDGVTEVSAAYGHYVDVATPQGNVFIANMGGASPENGDTEARILIDDWSGTAPAPGIWTITIGAETIDDTGVYDGWLTDDSELGGLAPYLSGDADNRMLVGKPGGAYNAITVGSYALHNPLSRYRVSWTDVNGIARTDTTASVGEISDFSSPGKTRDGRIKPELAAPGERVMGAVSQDARPGLAPNSIYRFHPFPQANALLTDDTPGHRFGLLQGTSFAAPVVAGLAARLLSTDPGLDAVEVRNMLVTSALADGFTGPVPNELWGYGKANQTLGTGGSLPPGLRIAVDALPPAILDRAYSFVLTASGGTLPYSWSLVSGALPAGINLAGRGLLAGKPTQTGTFVFTIRVTDTSLPAETATRALSLSVKARPDLQVLTSVLPPAHLVFDYDQPLEAQGGTPPYTWSLLGGDLPPGLALNASGRVQGNASELGKYYFTVQVEDAASAVASRTVKLRVGRFGSEVWQPLGIWGTEVNSLAIDPNNPNHLFSSTTNIADAVQNAIFESTDAGESWKAITGNNNLGGGGKLAVSPAQSVLWARSSYRYDPVAKLWIDTDPGASGALGFDASDNAFVLGGAGGAVRRSPDQGATWETLGTMCPGGSTYSLSISRLYPDYMYTTTCRSEDGGVTWTPLTATTGSYVGLEVSQSDPLDLVRTLENGAFNFYSERSLDGGRTWTRYTIAHAGGFDCCMARGTSDPAVVLFGLNSGGVFRSTDHGQTWARLMVGGSQYLDVTSLAIDPFNADKFWVGSAAGVFYTEDGGLTWSRKSRGLTRRGLTGIAISPRNPSDLLLATTVGEPYLSRTSGERWTASGTSLSAWEVKIPLISAADPNVFFMTTHMEGIHRSDNKGLTWTEITPTTTFGWSVQAAAADPFDVDHLLVDTTDGLFRSTDRGETWTAVPGVCASQLAYAHDVAGRVYTACGSLARSDDGGLTWTEELAWGGLGLIEAAPSDSRRAYAASTSSGQVYYRDPPSGVWQPALSSPPRPVNALAVEWSDPLTAYAGVDHPGTAGETGGLYKTTDGGAHWARLPGVLDAFTVVSVATHPTRAGGVFAATYDAGVYRSLDGGATWTSLPSYGTVAEVVNLHVKQPGGSLQFAATEGYGVQVSSDGGNTFTPSVAGLANFNVHALAFETGSSTTLYAGTDAGIFRSTNSGSSWSPTGQSSGKITDIVTDSDGSGRKIWATVDGQGVAYSGNDGATFTVYSSGLASLELTSLELDNSGSGRKIWATTRGGDGVVYSDDNGQTWKPAAGNGLTSRNLNEFTLQQGAGRKIWATTDDGVFFSENDGLSWTELSLGLPGGVPVTSISIDPNSGEALVSLFSDREGGVFRGGNLQGVWSAFTEGLEELKVRRLTNDRGHVVSGSVNGTTFFAATEGDGVYQNEVQTLVATAPTITTAQLADAVFRTPYTAVLAATGGTPPYFWSVRDGALPPGLTLDGAAGTITGDPGQVGSFSFTLQVSDSNQQAASRALGIEVVDPARPPVSVDEVTLTEGNSGTRDAVFTVRLGAVPSQTVSVAYQTADGTATAGSDYVFASGTLSFGAGVTSRTLAIAINGDPVDEADERFSLVLGDPVGCTIADGVGVGTILDDDGTPQLSIGDLSVTEGNAGTTDAAFTVSLLPAAGQTVTVDYATANGTTASVGGFANASLIAFPFLSGTASPYPSTLSVPPLPGTVTKVSVGLVRLNHPSAADADILLVGPTGQGVLLMSDAGGQAANVDLTFDDAAASALPASGALSSGTYKPTNFGAGDSFPSPAPVGPYGAALSAFGGLNPAGTWSLFAYDDSSGSSGSISGGWSLTIETTGGDYVVTSGTLSFSPGQTSRTLAVPVVGDTRDEDDETFVVNLRNPVNAAIADGQGLATILDDDPVPAVSVSDVTVTEGNAGSVSASFSVSLSQASGRLVTVAYAFADASATAGSDYTAVPGTLSFAPGTTAGSISVTVLGDVRNEANETLLVNLGPVTNAALADAQGLGTITDDDPLPSLSVGDAVVTEGNAGSVNAVFVVSLSALSGRTVTVNYATSNGTATAGSDYTTTSGTLSLAGNVFATIVVPVFGDTLDEDDETFHLTLSGASNALIADGEGATRILDDEPKTLSIDDVFVAEGDTGTRDALFTVRLSHPRSQKTVTVDYATADGTTDNARSLANAAAISIPSSGKATPYPSTLLVPPLGASVNKVSVQLTRFSHTNPADMDVLLVGPTGQSVILMSDVGWSASNVTLTFDDDAPGTIPQYGTLVSGSYRPTNVGTGDALPAPAPPEPYGTALAAFAGLDPAGTWSLYVFDDSTGFSGSIAGGWSLTLETDADYIGASGTLSFAPGTTTQTITVPVVGDTLEEDSETFFVNLSNPVHAALGDGQGMGMIVDDDGAPRLQIADAGVSEGTGTAVDCVMTVALAAGGAGSVSVSYATGDGTATAPGDYTTRAGRVSFAPGDVTRTIRVPVVGDTAREPNETFLVNLSSPSGASLSDAQGVCTILDNDPPPGISIGNTSVTEGDSSSVDATFSVSLSHPSFETVSLSYATADGTASGGGIISSNASSIAIPSSGTATPYPSVISVPALPGTVNKVTVTLKGFSHIYPGDVDVLLVGPAGQGVILMSDVGGGYEASGVDLTLDDAAATGLPGYAPLVTGAYKPTNSGAGDNFPAPAPAGSFGTSLAVFNGQGPAGDWSLYVVDDVAGLEGSFAGGWTLRIFTSGGDYRASLGTLSFPPGNTTQALAIAVNGDTLDETSETFFVNLSGAVNGTIADGQGVGTIVDDEISILPLSLPPGVVGSSYAQTLTADAGTAPYTFSLSAGALPPGLTLAPGGLLSGTPTTPGAFGFTARVVDAAASSASRAYTVVIDCATLAVAPSTLPGGVQGVDYQRALTASGGTAPYAFTLSAGTPPPGLTLTSGGLLAGTPTKPGSFAFTVTASDRYACTGSRAYSVVIDCPTLSISPSTLPDGNLDTPYRAPLTVAEGIAPYTYVLTGGAPPPGVTLASGGLLAGTPTARGSSSFSVAVTDANGCSGSGGFSIFIDERPPLMTIDDVVLTEGDAGSQHAVFSVSLAHAAGWDLSVDYATAAGTAKPIADYMAASGTLWFPAGTTTRTIVVPVLGDARREPNEAFVVRLTKPNRVLLGRSQGQGVIRDDDRAFKDPCTPVLVPLTISAPGRYCVGGPITTSLASGAAIRIEADGVTLDLRGFTLRNTAGPATSADGISASQRRDLSVRNGSVRGFRVGVRFTQTPPYTQAQGLVVERVSALDSTQAGLWVEGRGSLVQASGALRTAASPLAGPDQDAYGIVVAGPEARLNRNRVSGTRGLGAGRSYGVRLTGGDDSVLIANLIGGATGAASSGVRIEASARVGVSANRFFTLEQGIVFAPGATGTAANNIFVNVTTPQVGP